MKKLQKYIMMALLTCSLMPTLNISASDKGDKAADAAGNVIVRLSRASGLSDATNASILTTVCAFGAFMVYRWHKNKQIKVRDERIEELTSKHERKKDLVLKLLLQPKISELIQERHLSYNPRKTGPEVDALFKEIIETFLSETKMKATPAATEYTTAMIESFAKPEVAAVLSQVAHTAIDVSTGTYTTTKFALEDIESFDDITTRITKIIIDPIMKRRIEAVYPDGYKDSWKITKVIRWGVRKTADATIGR